MFFNTKKYIRKIGYISDQNGIIKRYINEEDNWKDHLNNSKEYIIESSKNKQKNTVFILGSGWLLDVPIDYLSKTFNKVYLVDIVHPSQVVHKHKSKKNVIFLESDITGGAAKDIFEIVSNSLPFSNLKMSLYKYIEEPDFVVSINILNQLDIILTDFLLKKYNCSSNELSNFRKEIQKNHILSLPKEKSCLISDWEELKTDYEGNVFEKTQLIYIDIPKHTSKKQWLWHFDMHKTYNLKFNTIFNVLALNI